ncbi:histidine kinase [candidate division KSB1 bacterium]|nr:histidine kinase [candidate division KSB1 bacterium]
MAKRVFSVYIRIHDLTCFEARKRRRTVLPLLAGLIFCLQTNAGHAGTSVEFDRLSIEDGLSHGAVYSILQDKYGFIWFATEDSLNKYDGYDMTAYYHDPSNPKSLSASNFGKIYEDRFGILWLGTWGGGLDKFDQAANTYTHFRHDPNDPGSLSQDRIEFILEDSFGTLWIGTEEGGLNRFDLETETFRRFQHDPGDPNSLSNDRALAMVEDNDGILWIGTDDGLNRFDRQNEAFTHYKHDPADASSLSSSRIRALARDKNGGLWVGTRGGGLNLFNIKNGKARRYWHDPDDPSSLSDDSVSRLFVDSYGTLWVGTYTGGLNRFVPETGTFERFTFNPRNVHSLSNNRVEAFYQDRSGVLWIGTCGGGVNKLDLKPKKFTNYLHDPLDMNSLSHPIVRAIAERRSEAGKRVWLGTDGGGLSMLDLENSRYQHYRHDPQDDTSLSDDRVWALAFDEDGALWAGTYSGGLNLLVLNDGGQQFAHFRHKASDSASLSSDRVQAIAQDRQGRLWFGTVNGLNLLLPGTEKQDASFKRFVHHKDDATTLSDNYVTVIYEGPSGHLWIGTRGGLNRLQPETGTFLRFREDSSNPSSLSDNFIHALYEDTASPSSLWIATADGGLNRLVLTETDGLSTEATVFSRYLENDGLPGNVVDGILEDERHNIWLSTSRGLSRFDPVKSVFRNYDIYDGLRSHSFSRNACFKSKTGQMFFGSIAGLVSFFPERVHDNPHVPPVVITRISKFNKPLRFGRPLTEVKQVELQYDENFISFEFSALDFTFPEKNRYAYKLKGADQAWVEAGHRRFASYANLAPGEYLFTVKGANNDGVWNHKGTSVRIVITPPFWKTWWFRFFAVSSLTALLFVAHKLRTRAIHVRSKELETRVQQRTAELEAANKELESFSYSVSHDLLSPLRSINGFSHELMADYQQELDDKGKEMLKRIRAASKRMGILIDDLLSLSRISRHEMRRVEVDLSRAAHDIAAELQASVPARHVEFIIQPDIIVTGDPTLLRVLLENLLGNAWKFTAKHASAKIQFGQTDKEDMSVLFVSDDGAGFDMRYAGKLFKAFERLHHIGEFDGTGIGLATVQRIIGRHGGKIWAEGAVESGATFYFTI